MPSTSTFQAGSARPPMMSVLAGRCAPSRATGAHRSDIGRVAHDRGNLHQIPDLHTGGTQLRPQIPPSQCALRLGVFWDTAISSNADLPTEVECTSGPGHFHSLVILACGSRRVRSVDVATLHRLLLDCAPPTGARMFLRVQAHWTARRNRSFLADRQDRPRRPISLPMVTKQSRRAVARTAAVTVARSVWRSSATTICRTVAAAGRSLIGPRFRPTTRRSPSSSQGSRHGCQGQAPGRSG